jgi:hypothetical protein
MNLKPIFTTALVLVTLFAPLSLFGQDFEMDGTVLVRCQENSTNVVIPEGVTAIANGAFFGSQFSLTSVTIPSSVASIGNQAFSGCGDNLPVTVSRRTTIGSNAFPRRAQITYSD